MSIDLNKYPLDSEMLQFLQDCAAQYPHDNGALGVNENRRLYLSLCAAYSYPLANGMTVRDEVVQANGVSIDVRRYTPENRDTACTVIYYHGGGFVVGNLDSHHSICADLAAGSRCELVAVDYRLSPESQHPAAFDDALAAFQAIDRGRTILCGDSAGGTLTGAVCAATRQATQKPIGQVLIYPWLGGELFDLDSYQSNHDAPGLTTNDLGNYRDLRTHNGQALDDATYYPLALADFSGMPPCISIAAEFDPLRDDSTEYIHRLAAAGVDATNHVEPGLIHGYLRARRVSQKAGNSFDRICQSLHTIATNYGAGTT